MKKLAAVILIGALWCGSLTASTDRKSSLVIPTTAGTVYAPKLPALDVAKLQMSDKQQQLAMQWTCPSDRYIWFNYFLGLGNVAWLAMALADGITGGCAWTQ